MDFVVRDYLAVKEAKVRVDGLTVVRGESYSGKSSMFRAIEAAMTNRFASGCVRWGTPQCSVSVRFGGSGSVLKVTKAEKGGAVYDLDGCCFDKTARAVPAEVRSFLGCGYLRAGSDTVSLNFWEQFSKPLLWSFSQAKISEMLGNGEALAVWSGVNKNLTGRRSELKGAEGVLLHQVDSCRAELASWEGLVDAGGVLFEDVSAAVCAYDSVVARVGLLEDLRALLLDVACVEGGICHYRLLLNECEGLASVAERDDALHSLQLLVGECSDQRSLVTALQEGIHLYGLLGDCAASDVWDVYRSLCGLRSCLLFLAWCDQEYRTKSAALVLADLQVLGVVSSLTRDVCGVLQGGWDCIFAYKGFEMLLSLSECLMEVRSVHKEIEFISGLLGANVCPFCGSEVNV